MFPLHALLFAVVDVTYYLLKSFISKIRERGSELGEIGHFIEYVSENSLKTQRPSVVKSHSQRRRENASIETITGLIRGRKRQNRRKTYVRLKRLIQRHLIDAVNNRMRSSMSVSKDPPKTMKKITDVNVATCRFNLPRTIVDLYSTLTTGVSFTFPFWRDDVSAAMRDSRVLHTAIAAVSTFLCHQESFYSIRQYKNRGERKGMEVILHRPQFFTLDLTIACEVARIWQSIPAGPIYTDCSRLTKVNIYTEFLADIDSPGLTISDETEVDGVGAYESTMEISERCQQRSAAVAMVTTSEEEDGQHTNNLAFLYDEQYMRRSLMTSPIERIKWEDPGNVTDCSFDMFEVESWDVEEMLTVNEGHFGVQSTFNVTMPEYTTVLVEGDSADYRLRWERACRLADEIEAAKRAEQEELAKLPKKRKRKNRKRKQYDDITVI